MIIVAVVVFYPAAQKRECVYDYGSMVNSITIFYRVIETLQVSVVQQYIKDFYFFLLVVNSKFYYKYMILIDISVIFNDFFCNGNRMFI